MDYVISLLDHRGNMKGLIFLIAALSINMVNARSKEDTGYQKPIPYFQVKNSEDMRELAIRYLPSNPVVVEAGAYDGSESQVLARIWPNGHIHSFEPIEQLYEKVVENTKNIANITTYKLALGQECGKQPIFLALNPEDPSKICMSSSLYPPKDHLLYYGPIFKGEETIDVITLDAWAKENKIEKVDLLWFDIQGYELSAFKGASQLLSTVSVIMTELEFSELYEGQPLYKEVKAWLETQGFVLIGGDFSFPKEPNQHFGDGLFVRRELL